ncbi:MAG: cytochrome c family protein [Desulfobacteraceae bacterium]|nr:cytochrome c family protein [Desulfobacteraceae bacterium]MCF8095385.1 cytochrome c family protein [Desulfobacteraceae bacterium]
MSKRLGILSVVGCVIAVFLAAGLYAGTNIPDTVEMKNEKAFDQHRMPIVEFSHQKHTADKPDGYGVSCGECHHDENGEPLTDLKAGDEVHHCFECHSGKGAGTPKDFMGPPPDAEALNSYYTAVHVNCVGCHKKQDGPKACNQCHTKK